MGFVAVPIPWSLDGLFFSFLFFLFFPFSGLGGMMIPTLYKSLFIIDSFLFSVWFHINFSWAIYIYNPSREASLRFVSVRLSSLYTHKCR